MSKNIKGITIEIGGDTRPLDKALGEVNKTSKSLQDELRSVNRLLKFDPKNTEMLGQKQKILAEQVDNSREKLDRLRKAQKDVEQSFRDGDINVEQYRHFQRQVANAESDLKYFEKQLKKTGITAEQVGKTMQSVGGKMTGVGKDLTKKITAPILGVTTAVAGMVASFGWGRLKAVDEAKSQLIGLGYSVEDVGRISDNLANAIQGGMMTMAEATSAAATAMAAGVQEGDELTRYIRILDSAVVGGTGNFAEMEQIFGRITDQGKMTRTEFDMIAQRMPGFSNAVQEHMGVGSDAMYEMLRNGKISSSEFLDIMEGFAGGMADAYADTWSGMASNTKANIGIIGESLLSGVFAQSKESIAEFLELLRSKDFQDWAKEAGASIGEAFSDTVDAVKSAVEWFTNLSPTMQKVIVGAVGLAAVIGPLLIVLGLIVSSIGSLVGVLPVLAGGFSLLIGPVGIVIAIIAGLIAIGVALYNNWDTISAKAGELRSSISANFTAIRDGISEKINAAKEAVRLAIEKIKGFFNFEWSLPKIKLPHFNIKGKFSLSPPSVPKFAVNWYKTGGIFNAPSVIGVGEAGPEAVIPIDRLKELIGSSTINHTGTITVRGVNNEGQLVAVVEATLGKNIAEDSRRIPNRVKMIPI